MKRLAAVLLVFALAGCATNDGLVKKEVELVSTPIPFCPAPPEFTLEHEAGVEMIVPETPAGEVAKLWRYEATYWRGVAELQQVVLEMYKKNAVNLDQLKGELGKMIDSTNQKLKETPAPSQTR